MDTKKYEALLYSIDLGSFSAAAAALGYTPAGISKMVDCVENEMGLHIIKRGHGGVAADNRSKDIISEIRQIVRHESVLRQRISDINGIVTGSVTVGSYYSIATHWLPDILHDFLKIYPGVDIQIREGGHQFLSRWVEESEIDFCIYSFDPDTNYNWYPLRDDRMVVVVPEGHPLSAKKAVTFGECCNYPFIMPALGQDYDIMRLLEAHPMNLNVRFSTVENYAAIAMVESNLGISIMNELITKGLKRKVVCIPFAVPQTVSMGIAVPNMQTISPAAKKLVQFICRAFSE